MESAIKNPPSQDRVCPLLHLETPTLRMSHVRFYLSKLDLLH